MEEFGVLKQQQKEGTNWEEGRTFLLQHESKELEGVLKLNSDHTQEESIDETREDMLRAFIINRFLPAAKAVATGHESSAAIACKSDNRSPLALTLNSPGKKKANLHLSMEHTLSSSWSKSAGDGSTREESKATVNLPHGNEKQPSAVKSMPFATSSTATTLSSSPSTEDQPKRRSFSHLNNASGRLELFEKSDGVHASQDAIRSGSAFSQHQHINLSGKLQRIKMEGRFCEQEPKIYPKHLSFSMKTVAMNSSDKDDEEETMFYDASSKLNPSRTMGSDTCDVRYSEASVDWENDSTAMASQAFDLYETTEFSTNDCKPKRWDTNHVKTSVKSSGSSLLRKRFGKSLTLETGSILLSAEQYTPEFPCHEKQHHHHHHHDLRSSSSFRTPQAHISHHSFTNSPACSSSRSFVPPIFPPKCQNNDIGWPFGISKCRFDTQVKCLRQAEKQTSLCVPSPPLPPSPSKGSWLEKVITSTASKPSTLFTLQQNQKVSLSRKKLDFLQPSENILDVSDTSARSKLDHLLANNERQSENGNKTPSSSRKNSDAISMFHKSKLSMMLVNAHRKQKSLPTKNKLEVLKAKDETEVNDMKPWAVKGLEKRERQSARKKLEFVKGEEVVEVKWEDVVKGGSKRNTGKEVRYD